MCAVKEERKNVVINYMSMYYAYYRIHILIIRHSMLNGNNKYIKFKVLYLNNIYKTYCVYPVTQKSKVLLYLLDLMAV